MEIRFLIAGFCEYAKVCEYIIDSPKILYKQQRILNLSFGMDRIIIVKI